MVNDAFDYFFTFPILISATVWGFTMIIQMVNRS